MCETASNGSSDSSGGSRRSAKDAAHTHDHELEHNHESETRAPLARRAVRFYQENISGLKMASTCRFEPTCSNYALTALGRHGLLKGLLLSIGRLFRCAPWHPGGWDPVPPVKKRLKPPRAK